LEKIGTICLKHHVVVVADEIHEEFVRTGKKHTVFASIKPEFAEIAITCTAPSKTFNLAGLQISNIFIENKDIKKRFTSEMYASGYSQPNALGLFAAKAAYKSGGEWLEQLLVYLEENLQKTKAFLQDELPLVKLIEPEGTYLIWLDFSAYGLSDEKINQIIKEKAKLWLDEGEIFGPEGQGFQRINTACPWATLEKGLLQLKTAFAAL
jgi:Bifunctional PLP-dependent enzyme with beta-cystathionase and maltose regulon repressor activities